MIGPLSSLVPLRTKTIEHYPDLAPLRAAVRRSDWAAVSAHFGGFPARADRSTAVRVVAETAGSERFLQRVVDTQRDSSLARTLLGARFIVTAWDARGATRAKYVKGDQWRVFHDHLRRADGLLADATAIDPFNAAAWSERVTAARGLSLGQDEGRRRYERAAELCDAPYGAQRQLLQTLCPKWGGSVDAVLAFARECAESAKPGELGAANVAAAHAEIALDDDDAGVARHLTVPQVREEVAAAAARSVLHPDFRPVHGWLGAHSVFAFDLFHAAAPDSAAVHFAAMGNRVNSYPWDAQSGLWKSDFRQARRAVGVR
ncbi:hypothetical protein [Virgisporangium aurantiacum]|uniref:hypothetical protein n=1 Tax=Virgisporangium aurantiacum TaxID=175570 RepID=UPI001951CB1F|nr:hypothetical protein [Virgisporangium aurantiacum]